MWKQGKDLRSGERYQREFGVLRLRSLGLLSAIPERRLTSSNTGTLITGVYQCLSVLPIRLGCSIECSKGGESELVDLQPPGGQRSPVGVGRLTDHHYKCVGL